MSDPQIPTAPYGAPAIAPKGSNGLAVAGFVLGLLGALGSFIPVVNIGAIVLAVVGIILAGIGLARSKAVRAGKGLAIAGIVLGVLAIIIAIIIDAAVGKAIDDATSNNVDTSTVKTPGAKSGSGGGDSAKTAAGTRRTDPAPLGSSITGGDWTVRINSVKTVNSDSMGQSAPAGKTLLLVNLTATYNGRDAQGDSSFATVKYVARNGRSYDQTSGNSMWIPDHQFDLMRTLYHGGNETGNELIEIPTANWKAGVLAVSPGMLSDDTFIALK
ncbi:hypothetical protein GCM10028801_28590 [Nocardioides maradonensis]